jgi:uncharacterized spore protein YtfJ
MDAGTLLDKVSDHLSVRRAFGSAYEKDGTLIIPVALVAGGGGAGTSRTGRGKPATGGRPEGDDPAHDASPQDPEPKDAGGGFGGLVMPTGVYVVKGDQVRWVPAVDTTIVVLASLSLARLLARAWTRRRRGQRDRSARLRALTGPGCTSRVCVTRPASWRCGWFHPCRGSGRPCHRDG